MHAPLPQEASSIVLERLRYELLPTPFRGGRDDLCEVRSDLAQRVGASAAAFLAESEVDQYAIGTTLNSPYRSDPALGRDLYQAELAVHAGRAPDLAVNMYECTNWAFLLRYAQRKVRHAGRSHRICLQIVDADIHGLKAAWSTKAYGNARFGILNLMLWMTPDVPEDAVEVGAGPVDRSMMKFSAGLRRLGGLWPHARIAGPFFPEPVRDVFRRSVPGPMLLPDRHDDYGHCFGADPWIAVGLDRPGRDGADDYCLGSLALSGYYATVPLHVPAGTPVAVEAP